jgi:protease-4
VTALKSRRQVADDLKGLVGEDDHNHSFNGIGMSQYLAAVRSRHALKSKADSKVGIVVASGEIFDGRQLPGKIGGDSTSDLLREARFDTAVKAVVLRVDSPGGSEFASEKILREVQALRKAGKPVVVSMSTYAASGGYYIAAAANQIFASPTTITGSIGVFSYLPTFQRTLEKLGVKVDGLGTTPLAGDMRVDRALGPVTKQLLQASVDHAYQQFLRRVADGRKKSVEDIDKIAQGRVWAGADAQRIGLVDHLGGLKDATDAAAKLAQLGADYGVDYIETELSLREQLLMQIRSQAVRAAEVAGLMPQRSDFERMLDPLLEQARIMARLKDPRGLYSYCWCREPSGP